MATLPEKHAFTIDGTDTLGYLYDYEITETYKEAKGNSITIFVTPSITDVKTLTLGQRVVITRGVTTADEFTVFIGYLSKIQEDEEKNMLRLQAQDDLHKYDKLYLTQTFDKNISDEVGEISAIFKTIVDDGPYTASVVSSGTATGDLTLDRFRSFDRRRIERMRTLAQILDWVYYQDYDNEYIRLEPRGYTTYGTPLVVGSNIVSLPVWEDDIERMRNKIKVKGATDEGTRTESFSGDGSTVTFTLQNTPISIKVDVDGTEQLLGVEGQSEDFDFSIDRDLKQVIFESAPASGTDNVVIEYTYPRPRPVVAEDDSSQGTYGVTQEEVYEFDDITTVTDAETRAAELLKLLATPPSKTTLRVSEYTIRPGMQVEYSNPRSSLRNGNYVVFSVKRSFRKPYDVIKIGDTDFNIDDLFDSIEERLRAVEESGEFDTGLLRQVLQASRTTLHEKRYEDRYNRSVSASNYLYWQDDYTTNGTNGQWNNFQWAPDSWRTDLSNFTLVSRIQGNNKYLEFLYDQDFYDSSNSTNVTWDTANQAILFDVDGGTLLTNAITIGTAYTHATLSAEIVEGGSLTYEISADGKSTWQTITEDERTELTSSDTTGLYLRVTSQGETFAIGFPIIFNGGTIQNTYKDTGAYNVPAIKLVLEN